MSGFDDTRDDPVARARAKEEREAAGAAVILATAAEAVRTFATGATTPKATCRRSRSTATTST